MLIAVWVSQRPLRATVTRRLVAPRVARGDPIRLVYRLHNTTRFRSGRATIIDCCDGEEARVPIGSVLAHSATVDRGHDPDAAARRVRGRAARHRTHRPVLADHRHATHRPDRRRSSSTPRCTTCVGPQGAVRTVESESVLRRATADPMSGFVSMREYVPGDDPRMIHWPTSARAGTLMVREHVEVRRPEFTVVLDTAHDGRQPPRTSRNWSTSRPASRSTPFAPGSTWSSARPTAPTPAARFPLVAESMVLDLLTPVQQSTDDDLLSVASLFAGGFDHTSVLIVTGPIGPVEPVRRRRTDDGGADRRRGQRLAPGSPSAADGDRVRRALADRPRDRSRSGFASDRSARRGVRRARRRRRRDLRLDRVGPDRHAGCCRVRSSALLARRGAVACARSARSSPSLAADGDRRRLGRRQRRRRRRRVTVGSADGCCRRNGRARSRGDLVGHRRRRAGRDGGAEPRCSRRGGGGTCCRSLPVVVTYVGVVALVVAARPPPARRSSLLCAIAHPLRHAARRRQRPRSLAAPARRATTARARRHRRPARRRDQRLRCRSPPGPIPDATTRRRTRAALLDPIEATIALRALEPADSTCTR